MSISEGFHDLRISNDQTVNDRIGNQCSDQLSGIMHRKRSLLIDGIARFSKLDDKRPLIEFFVQSGAKFIEHCHRSPDDLAA